VLGLKPTQAKSPTANGKAYQQKNKKQIKNQAHKTRVVKLTHGQRY